MPLLIVVASFIVLAALVMIVASHHPFFKQTSSTVGEVTEVVPGEAHAGVTVGYAVHGERFSLVKRVPIKRAKPYTLGRRVRVWYNPANPAESRLPL